MKNIPIANEFFNKYGGYTREEMLVSSIEFAKLHVKAALREATKVLKVNNDADWIEYPTEERIKNSYPLENIK